MDLDLQHWDLIYQFSLYEAACLAAGHDPNLAEISKSLKAKIDLIQEQLHNAHTFAEWDTTCRVPDLRERDDKGLYSLRMSAKDYKIGEDKSPRFHRDEIGRWFKDLGYRTVYPFNHRDPLYAPRVEPISSINTLSKVTTTKTDRNVQGARQSSAASSARKPTPGKRNSRRAPQLLEETANAGPVIAVIPAEQGLRGTFPQTLLRLPDVITASGLSKTTIYARIEKGLWPRQVHLGPRLSVWPASEVAALTAAHIAGNSDEEIRQLVVRLFAARKPAA